MIKTITCILAVLLTYFGTARSQPNCSVENERKHAQLDSSIAALNERLKAGEAYSAELKQARVRERLVALEGTAELQMRLSIAILVGVLLSLLKDVHLYFRRERRNSLPPEQSLSPRPRGQP